MTTTPTPERCPLCHHEDSHTGGDLKIQRGYCDATLFDSPFRCLCMNADYRAALRGHHSRDEEVAAITERADHWQSSREFLHSQFIDVTKWKDQLYADNAAKDRRIDDLVDHLDAHGTCIGPECDERRKEKYVDMGDATGPP